MRTWSLFLIVFCFLASGCDRDNPVNPKPGQDQPPDPDVIRSLLIEGFVWQDENGDGLWHEGELRIENAVVELVAKDGEKTAEMSTKTDANGRYSLAGIYGSDFYLIFTPPEPYEDADFSKKGAGDDRIDSDVDARGFTDWFTLNDDFNRTLSAGIAGNSSIETVQTSIDERDDCREVGSEGTQACPGDLHTCQAGLDPGSANYFFSCTLGEVSDYSQLDLYVAFDIDGKVTTGKSDGSYEGIDMELFLNGLEGSLYLNTYDSSGAFTGSELLAPESYKLTLGRDENLLADHILIELRSMFPLQEKAGPETRLGFTSFYYPPAGGKLFDETQMLKSVFTGPG